MPLTVLVCAAVASISASQGLSPAFEKIVDRLPARSLGPTITGGRVTDLAVYEKAPRIFLVGAASGGVWKTENGGMSFRPIFRQEGSSSIGAVAMSQSNPNTIWVGTGEGTSRNSSGWGDGIYKTTDGGKTWQNMGLPESNHFSRILIDPKDDRTVYAAALGMLWGFNEERGVFKTTDGGKSWKKVLYIDDKTGIADIAMDPSNNRVLLAAAWEHLRKPYTFTSGGPGSGLYKSTDSGGSWRRIQKGLPPAPLGRMGFSYFKKDSRYILATVEAATPLGGIYRSSDRGESWKQISKENPRPFYFSQPRQDPQDLHSFYLPGVSLRSTIDEGKTFAEIGGNTHADFHALWINPEDPNHLLVGNDGGVYQSRDRGASWEHLNSLPIGQFYGVAFDMRKPYWVYGGLQDNGCWGGPTQSFHGAVSLDDFYEVWIDDGFRVQVDPDDSRNIYVEDQNGGLHRRDENFGDNGGDTFIKPKPPADEHYRANWNTPFIISPWNSKTLYYGANRLLKSVDRGDHWKAVSPDLTQNNTAWQKPGVGSVTPEATGAETYDTITSICESPLTQGLIWAGTDDGNLQLTRDGGEHWENVVANVNGLPENSYVSCIAASRFKEGRAYVSFDRHRSNDFHPYVYETDDFGKTWASISGNVPASHPCYVIKEGLKNPDLLFLGTEFSLYVSLSGGKDWVRYRNGPWPTVPVFDLAIQPTEEDLIIGTHGASIWLLPIGSLEELTPANLAKDVYLLRPPNAYIFAGESSPDWTGDRVWTSPNTQPGTTFSYYLKTKKSGQATITVSQPDGSGQIGTMKGPCEEGLNMMAWSLPEKLPPGDYRVTLQVGLNQYATTLHVEHVTAEGH